MITLPRGISKNEMKQRLRMGKSDKIKEIANDISDVAKVNINMEQDIKNIRKTIRAVYFRKRELANDDSFNEDNDIYTFDSLVSCPFTERHSLFNLYRYIYENVTPGEEEKRDKIYDICKSFYENKSQDFKKQTIYTMTRIITKDQEDMDKRVLISKSNKRVMVFNRIYTWKNNKPVVKE